MQYDEYLRICRNGDHPEHGRIVGFAFAGKPEWSDDAKLALQMPLERIGKLYRPEEVLLGGNEPLYKGFAALSELAGASGLGLDAEDRCSNPTADAADNVFKFVERYGLVLQSASALPCCFFSDIYRDANLRGGDAGRVNSVAWVLLESLTLRRAIVLADGFREVRRSGIPNAVKNVWKGSTAHRQLFGQRELVSSGRTEQELTIARRHLSELVQQHASLGRVGFRTIPVRTNAGRSHFYDYRFEEVPDYGTGLLGAMWVQFARDYLLVPDSARRCLACGMPFEPTRRDQLYCSKACGGRLRTQRSRSARMVAPEEDELE